MWRIKSVTLGEDYFRDHFPRFPVMPGVLMLECMFQSAAWLLRVTDGFSQSLAMLKEAKNVRYSGMVRPGDLLQLEATMESREGTQASFQTHGELVGGTDQVVRARLVVETANLADQDASLQALDSQICQQFRRQWEILTQTHSVSSGATG